MRHADIEEEIMERGVHQGEGEEKPPVMSNIRLERATAATGYGQYNQTSRSKADTRKEHLAARHVRRDTKCTEAYLDKRESPSPRYCRCQGK